MLRQFFLLALLLGTHSVHAGQLAGSGDRLQMLRKIQGQWHSGCHQASAGLGYQRITLRFSYTHLYQRVVKYADQQCQRHLVEQEKATAFVLGDVVITTGGERAYAIDFRRGDGDASTPRLHPANLIDYRDGQLRLGLADARKNNQRLAELDYQLAFTRR